MDKQNVTLSLPKDAWKKGKILAAERGVSLNELVRQLLVEACGRDEEYERAAERQIRLMKKGVTLGTKGKVSWTRDELYER